MWPILAFFGPVPSSGDPTLPGIILFAIGLLGLLSLPAQIRKIKSVKFPGLKIAFLVMVELFFVVGGLVMLSQGLKK